MTRDTETASDWKLADAKPDEKLDSSKTSSFSYALSSPSFNDVLPADTKPEQAGLDKPTVVTLDTFDNFTYTIKLGQKTNDNLPMVVAVTAQIPKERTPGKDEKPEDKTRLDKEFKEKQKKLEDKLSQEKSYEKWVYLVSNWTVDSLLKERAQLLVEKKEEPKKDEKPAADRLLEEGRTRGASRRAQAGREEVIPAPQSDQRLTRVAEDALLAEAEAWRPFRSIRGRPRHSPVGHAMLVQRDAGCRQCGFAAWHSSCVLSARSFGFKLVRWREVYRV